MSVQTFQPLEGVILCIKIKDVQCTSIYLSLSYPFWSLDLGIWLCTRKSKLALNNYFIMKPLPGGFNLMVNYNLIVSVYKPRDFLLNMAMYFMMNVLQLILGFRFKSVFRLNSCLKKLGILHSNFYFFFSNFLSHFLYSSLVLVWLWSRLIFAGLEAVLSHTDKLCDHEINLIIFLY